MCDCVSAPAVVFPQDLLEKGLNASNFAMLGLGDIVIPGTAQDPTACKIRGVVTGSTT